MGWNRVISSSPYGDTWRKYRKLVHGVMHPRALKQYYPIFERDMRICLLHLLDSPDNFLEHLRLYAGKVIVMFTYGIKVETSQDEYITIAEEAISKTFPFVHPGAVLVDIFPPLRYVPSWFPGAGFKRNAKIWRAMGDKMATLPFNHVKADLAAGTAVPSFTATCLQEGTYSESDIMWSAGSMYLAAADTTFTTLSTFFLAMALYPDVQQRARAEIDQAVKPGTLPTFDDRPNLPYIECLLKELQRWHPATPVSVPHSLMEDDYYDGYFIPRGTIVIGNVWAISQDEANYREPTRFWPERFQDPETAELDPYKYVFGFGRRICAGVNFADATLYIAVVSILSQFTISKPLDENGNEVELDVLFTTGVISRPEPFKCTIRARSASAAALIRTTVEEQD